MDYLSDDWVLVEECRRLPLRKPTTKPDVTGIFTDLLIPGRGNPSKRQAVIAEDGRIVYVGSRASLPDRYAGLSLRHVPVLMESSTRLTDLRQPGMWECHAHFFGASPQGPIDAVNLTMGSPIEAAARNVRALKDVLYSGFTSCVDLGGYAPELRKVIEEGLIIGPTLYGAGAALSMTAGHGDVFELPYGSVKQKISVNAPGTEAGVAGILLADGPDECRKAVRLNLRRGAKVIKTSGGVTSRDDDFNLQQFSDEELKTIVDEAGRMGLVCAAHAVGKAGILAAVRAGFAVIEHNSFADAEVLEEIKKHNVMVVATITVLKSVMDNLDSYPPPMQRKAARVAQAHLQAYKDGIKAGVKFALGSDLFGGVGSVLSPGMNGNEIVYAVEAGMTPLQAIEAATANGPDTLGPQAPRSGQIQVGYDADFLALDSSPLDDISLLRDAKNLKYIWQRGRLVKAPGMDPWSALSHNR